MAVERTLVKVELINAEEGIRVSSENVTITADRLILRGMELEIVPHQTTMDIIAYYEDGLQFMWGTVTLSLPRQLNVEIMSNSGKREERRRNLKVRTSFDAKVLAMESLGNKHRKMKVNAIIRVRDLSLGGAGFFSNRLFFRNQKLIIDLSFLKPGFVTGFQVLRREKILNRGESGVPDFRYRYGGKVLSLSGEEERVVCEHVFKVQLTDYKRRKDRLG